jgi:hypothetical protein
MKRIITRQHKIILAGLGVLVLAAGIVWAVSPHFIYVRSSLQRDGDLDVSFKEAGLGTNQNINYEASADVTVTCNCVTNSGRCPSAANKQTSTSPVVQPATFNSGKNGQITQTITLEVPEPTCPASSGPTCPGGQTFRLTEISWTDIALTDTTNGITEPAVPDSQSTTLFECP